MREKLRSPGKMFLANCTPRNTGIDPEYSTFISSRNE
jgi:hypothetical protein